MGRIRQYAGRMANYALSPLRLSLVPGSATKTWHHPDTPHLLHRHVLPRATYSPWLTDRDFERCFSRIQRHTLVDVYRCYELWQLAQQLLSVEGDYLEVGVWRGGTGCLLATVAQETNKVVYLADTFSGVVKATANDPVYVGAEHADTSEQVVRDLAGRLQLKNVAILKGVFPDETSARLTGPIALLHCDVDVYESARAVVEWVIPRLSKGGAIVFDDYGFSGCEGVTKLVHEVRATSRFLFFHNLNGHAVLYNKG